MLKLPPQNKVSPTIFQIPDDFIYFLGVDSDGGITFRITLAVNVLLAISSQAALIKIGCYPLRKSGLSAGTIDAVSTLEFNKQITGRYSKITKANRAYRMTQIGETTLDMTAFISNDLGMTQITVDDGISVDSEGEANTTSSPLRQKISLELVGGDESIMAEDVQPVYMSAPGNIPSDNSDGEDNYRTTVSRLIGLSAYDPAQALDFDFPLIDLKHSIAGSIKVSNAVAYRKLGYHLEKKIRPPSQKNENQISTSVNSLRGSGNLKNFELSLRTTMVTKSLTSQAQQRVLRSIIPKFEMMNTLLKIPMSQRGRTFKLKLEFECYNINGKIIQKQSLGVNLGELMTAKEIPQFPPILRVHTKEPGLNYLRVRQQDPYAERIRIYRKILSNIRTRVGEPTFTTIADVSMKYGDSEIQLEDWVANGTIILYRAISVGRNSRQGSGFASAVSLPPHQTKKFANTLLNVPDYAVLDATIKLDRIEINAFINAPGVLACFLEARDITGLSTSRIEMQPARIVGNTPDTQLVSVRSGDTVFFSDEDITHNQTYYYSLVLLKADGRKITANGSLVKKFIQADQGLSMRIAFLPSPTPRPWFNITISASTSGLEKIVEELRKLGAEESYLEGIKSSRDEFSALYRFLVERRDLTNGEIVRLGIVGAGPFKDGGQLEEGHTYIYEFTALKREAYSLLRDVTSEEKDPTTLKAFARNLRKFRDPMTIKTATLPSNLELEGPEDNPNFSMEEKFLRGNTGLVRIMKYNVPATVLPTIVISAQAQTSGINTIVWSMDGNTSAIDHFIVFSEVDGIKAPIGTVLNLGKGVAFSFNDTKTSGIIGTKNYSIRPVFGDFNLGEESEIVTITRERDMSNIEVMT